MPLPELTPAVDPMEMLSILWAAGVGVAVLYCLVSFLVLKSKVAEAVKGDDGVRESGRVNAPFLLGYFKPDIYIPMSLRDADREFVIAHERTHILRGDNWWKLLGFICACVHWYNPAVWLGYVLLCRDIEIACDEQVVAKMDLQTRKAYSLALLNCGKRMSGLMTCPVAFGEVSLRQRIKNVLSYRRPGGWITAAAVLTVALVGVCFLTSPAESAPWSQQLPEAPAAPETEAALPTENDPSVTEAAGSRPEATTAASESTAEPETAATAPTEASTAPTEGTEETPKQTEPSVQETTGQESVDGVLAGGNWSGERDSWTWWSWEEKKLPRSVVIGYGITSIEDEAFAQFSNMSSISIPSSVTSIREAAFYCAGLYSVEIPASVSVIGDRAFQNSALQSVTLSGGVSYGKKVFESCYNLSRINFTGGVTTVTEGMFRGCDSLPKVTFPASITCIEGDAFAWCDNLATLHFQGSAPVIHKSAFQNVSATALYKAGDPTWTKEKLDDYSGYLNWCPGDENGFVTSGTFGVSDIFSWDLTDGVLRITGNGIMIIRENAPWYGVRDRIHTVIYEGTMQNVDGMEGCVNLRTIVWPKGLKHISEHAFLNCVSLTEVTLPSTLSSDGIGLGAFRGCTGLSSVTLPDHLTEIAWRVFQGCTSLRTIKLPAKLRTIFENAFSGSGLTQITIPSGVTKITEQAFANCASLHTVNLPRNLSSLAKRVFYNCDSLVSITVPASVKEVGIEAFGNCDSLQSVYFSGGMPSFNISAFADTSAVIYYPDGYTSWSQEKIDALLESTFHRNIRVMPASQAGEEPTEPTEPEEEETTQPTLPESGEPTQPDTTGPGGETTVPTEPGSEEMKPTQGTEGTTQTEPTVQTEATVQTEPSETGTEAPGAEAPPAQETQGSSPVPTESAGERNTGTDPIGQEPAGEQKSWNGVIIAAAGVLILSGSIGTAVLLRSRKLAGEAGKGNGRK